MNFTFLLYYSDNLRFGLQFSRKFVDGSEPERPNNFKTTKQKKIWSSRFKMNLHNNEVGRQVFTHYDSENIFLFSNSLIKI